MQGGSGNDVYTVDVATDIVTEFAGEGTGTDEIRTALTSYSLGDNVENLTFTGTVAFTGTGNDLNNVITGAAAGDTLSGAGGDDTLNGGSGNDLLDGGTGNDTMVGGVGNDIYIVESTGDVVTESSNGGTDEVRTSVSSYTLGTNVEHLRYTGTGDFTGTGNTLANTLTGGAGNDLLDGGSGIDTMIGGAGNDVYVVSVATDVVTENADEGTDEVRTALASYVLSAANVENLTYTGTGNFAGTGNIADNVITGGVGNDTLNGGSGSDTLIGGVGNDVYLVDLPTDVVVENAGEGTDEVRTALTAYTLGDNVENLTYTGTAAFTGIGNALNNVITGAVAGDTLSGAGGNDTLNGSSGDDTLDGGSGNDTMVGGAGNDSYIVDSAADVVTEALSAGTDEVRTSLASYTLGSNVEILRYTGSGSFTGTGNTLANILMGGIDNDVLNGGSGADTMIGGAGDDTYTVDIATDIVTENADEGTDEVRTALTSYTLGANVENLTFTGTAAFTGTGNTLDNVITGGNGADTLNGGAGNDTLNGGAGNDRMTGGTGDDIYVVSAAGDIVTENAGEGTDEIRTALASYTLGANVENLNGTGTGQTLTGNTLANTLSGGANETLVGGGGYDTYRVGAGMGHTIVNNAASDGVTTARGEVDLAAGVGNTQLWLERVGNDLQIDILGSSDHLTISGWYSGNARAQVQSFKTADGLTLDGQIEQLVSAMATYAAENRASTRRRHRRCRAIRRYRTRLRLHGIKHVPQMRASRAEDRFAKQKALEPALSRTTKGIGASCCRRRV